MTAKNIKKAMAYICAFFLLFLIFLFLETKKFIIDQFPFSNFSQILFFLLSGLEGTDYHFIETYFFRCLLPSALYSTAFLLLPEIMRLAVFQKILSYIKSNYINCLILGTFFIIWTYSIHTLLTKTEKIFPPKSTFYEENYVEPEKQNFTFPTQKKNLIIILLESFETTFCNTSFFGTNLLSPLQAIQARGISFQNYTNGFGTTSTQPAILALFSGVPTTLIPIDILHQYGKNLTQLKNTYTLGKILTSNHYHTFFISGINTNFAGQKKFLCDNGFQEKYLDSQNIEKMYPQYQRAGGWGYGDSDVFQIAANELKSMKEPFVAIINTIDTHHHYDPKISTDTHLAYKEYDTIYHTAQATADFLTTLQSYPYYQNTVIVLLGDHLRHGNDFSMPDERHIYNLFLNTDINLQERNRTFTQIDLFPTILEAIGVTWNSHRLGLGTSVFSQEQTLQEKFGGAYLERELSKRNDLYNHLW